MSSASAPIIEHQATLERAFSTGINLFLGAGFSVLSKDTEARPLPAGDTLGKELVGLFDLPGMESLPLPQLCTIIESTDKQRLHDYLRVRFSVGTYDKLYAHLHKLNVDTIFTTNIDNLIYKLYSSSTTHYLNDALLNGVTYRDRTAIEYVPLHGSVNYPTSQMAFSVADIGTAVTDDPAKWALLTNKMHSVPTLFWGYSMADAGAIQAISMRASKGRPQREKWICLRKPDALMERYFRALGFFIIVADTTAMLTYLSALVSVATASPVTVASTQAQFPEYSIPAIGTVPVRSLDKFLLGAAPLWHDVFSGELARASHYRQVIDCINAGKHGIFIGIPACGKTTLMMQVAAAADFNGHKLVCDSLTPAKAELMVRNLGPDRALVFIDNCSDNVDAINLLAASGKVQVIGFDCDYD